MPRLPPLRTPDSLAAGLLVSLLVPGAALGQALDPAAEFDRAAAAAESLLARRELAAAEARYREALFEGWLLVSALERLEGRLPEAREALDRASSLPIEDPARLRPLATAHLQMGRAARAEEILEQIVKQDARDVDARRLLAKALGALGRIEEAARRLDEAVAAAPEDPEQWFLLATEYLWLKNVEAAERLFARVREARPLPQTRILIGRTYRDAGEYERARAELRAALAQDAEVRRAHYYLGMVALSDARTDPSGLETAVAELREELKLAPEDPPANDQLGAALLDLERPSEALPFLETAARGDARFLYFHHLGRGLLALDRTAEAVTATQRALELGREQGAGAADLQKIHYQLGLALRKLGRVRESSTHLAEAGRLASLERSRAAGDAAEAAPAEVPPTVALSADAPALSERPAAERQALKSRVEAGLARACFNLGVLQAQTPAPGPAVERFTRAAELFEQAARLDPDFPQVQASLGVARFNARRFEEATAPLARALAASPSDVGLKRMLAMSWLNLGSWAQAAALLKDDPQRRDSASLEYAYALALARGGRGPAVDGAAVESLRRALGLDADLPEARHLLGRILLARGEAEEAAVHLEAAARVSPNDPEVREDLGRAYRETGRAVLADREQAAARRIREEGRAP